MPRACHQADTKSHKQTVQAANRGLRRWAACTAPTAIYPIAKSQTYPEAQVSLQHLHDVVASGQGWSLIE